MRSYGVKKIVEITILIIFVLGFRVLIEESIPLFEENLNLSFGKFLARILGNYPITIFMIISDIVIAYGINRYLPKERADYKFITIILGSLLVAFISSIFIRLPIWNKGASYIFFSDIYFNLTLLTAFVLNLLILSLFHIYIYYLKSHERALNIEIGKKNRAQYQYLQLKRQLNPHFLFNSLNVLDYLIVTDSDKASLYVKKLSSVYRYLLRIEESKTVSLREEIEFVSMYCDLLKERFTKGFIVEIDIAEECKNFFIIPGGLQMLVENATKHNIVSADKPLTINIYTSKDYVVVKNNLQLKINSFESEGIGLKNIVGQYKILFKKDVDIIPDSEYFVVKIPLVKRT